MKATEREKRLMGIFRQLESEKSRDNALLYAEAVLHGEKALREEYGLVGPDATLFAPRPQYSIQDTPPMGKVPA